MYRGHVQGADSDGTNIWWSFTSHIVRTDLNGRILKTVDVGGHHGDLCVRRGILYVAVERGRFNASGPAQSFVVSYRADTLEKLKEWPLAETVYGAGGITEMNGSFYVVGGLPPGIEENYVYQYDGDFRIMKKHVLKTGYTRFGIQTISYDDEKFLLGFYGDDARPAGTFICKDDFLSFSMAVPDCSTGFFRRNGKRMRVLYRQDNATKLYGAGAEELVLNEFKIQK